MNVQSYIEKNKIKETIETVVNKLIKEMPNNAIVYMHRALLGETPSEILNVRAMHVYNSSSQLTIKCTITTHKGEFEYILPIEKSNSVYEPFLECDNTNKSNGQSFFNIIEYINTHAKNILIGENPCNQKHIDTMLANCKYNLMVCSVAVCKAGAAESNLTLYRHISQLSKRNIQLPLPLIQIQKLDYCTSISVANIEIDYCFKNLNIDGQCSSINITASELYEGHSNYRKGDGIISSSEHYEQVEKYAKDYTIIQDPFDQDDIVHFTKLHDSKICKVAGNHIIGGDLQRLNKYKNILDIVVVMINQFKTLSDLIAMFNNAKQEHLGVIISVSSCESDDTFIADLAVGLGSDYVQFGPFEHSEYINKYNRLIELSHIL